MNIYKKLSLLLLTILIISKCSFAQNKTTNNSYRQYIDSLRNELAKTLDNLYIEEKTDYYELCYEFNNESIKSIAFKAEFETIADSVAIWLQNNKFNLVRQEVSSANRLFAGCANGIGERIIQHRFNHKVWLAFADNYKKAAKKKPTKYIGILLLAGLYDEAATEITKHNISFSISGFYFLLAMESNTPESFAYMDRCLAILDTTTKGMPEVSSYRWLTYIGFPHQNLGQ